MVRVQNLILRISTLAILSPSTLLSGGVDSSLISSIYTKISGRKIDKKIKKVR
jgi:hypothetical protein